MRKTHFVMKKSFVSLVFSSRRMQVIQLDFSQKKVVKYGSFDLKPSLIVNRQVKDPTVLAEIIKSVWSSLGLREKSVGLVVPEFSTYTKSLKLPELEMDELDEAVNWQSQDFLPTGGLGMIMDWQIVEEEADGGYKVLAVAIGQEVLSGYVDAASKAGLYPLVVETPSLSLSRVVPQDETRKLILYVSVEETVIVLVQGKMVVASSVASSNSQNEIIQTAQRMMTHYSEVGVEKVYLGGAGLSQQFMQSLQSSMKLPVAVLDYEVGGLERAQVQEYLVGISLQGKDPAGPEDERTINLLPPAWEKHYKVIMRNVRFWTLTLIASIVIWASFLASLGAYMILSREVQVVETKNKVGETGTGEEVFEEILMINGMIDKVLSVKNDQRSAEELVNKVASFRQGGVRIDEYSVNLEKGYIQIIGKASGRGVLLAYKETLEAEEDFLEVQMPISNLIGEGELDFEMNIIFSAETEKEVPKLQI